jgi:hypothetical protein
MGTDMPNDEVAFLSEGQANGSLPPVGQDLHVQVAASDVCGRAHPRALVLCDGLRGLVVRRRLDALQEAERLGQKVVERLVRTHTNLILEGKIQLFEDEGGVPVLPWDLEMVPQEPEDSDDEEG